MEFRSELTVIPAERIEEALPVAFRSEHPNRLNGINLDHLLYLVTLTGLTAMIQSHHSPRLLPLIIKSGYPLHPRTGATPEIMEW